MSSFIFGPTSKADNHFATRCQVRQELNVSILSLKIRTWGGFSKPKSQNWFVEGPSRQLGEQLNKGDQSTESVRVITLTKYKGSQVSKVVKGDQLTWGSWCQSGQVMITSVTKFPCLLRGVPKQCKYIQVLHEDLVYHQEASLVQRQDPVFSQSTLLAQQFPKKLLI